MANIVEDKRVGNAILRKLCKENDVNIKNVWLSQWGYVKNVIHEKDVDFCQTEYKGSIYKVQYISGCFYPFIVKQS
jgi:hypothetical protein